MIIRVKDIPLEGRTLQFSLGHEEFSERLGPSSNINCLIDPVASIHLEVNGKTVVAEGSVSGEFRAVCARCAEEMELKLNTRIEMVFKPYRDNGGDEDVQLSFYDGERLDLRPMAEEGLILSIPMTTVCSPNCNGLCPVCGENRNIRECSCRETAPDERFQVLRALKLSS
jgi:uncharacterized protein